MDALSLDLEAPPRVVHHYLHARQFYQLQREDNEIPPAMDEHKPTKKRKEILSNLEPERESKHGSKWHRRSNDLTSNIEYEARPEEECMRGGRCGLLERSRTSS
jgi:hypothetical protein